MGIRTIDRVTTGTRVLAGTEWPVERLLQRQQCRGERPRWVVVHGVCNGIAQSAEEFGTLRDARDVFEGEPLCSGERWDVE